MPSLPQGFLVFPQRHKGFEEPEGAQHRHVGCKVYVFQNQHQMITWPLQMKRDRINWRTRMISFTETNCSPPPPYFQLKNSLKGRKACDHGTALITTRTESGHGSQGPMQTEKRMKRDGNGTRISKEDNRSFPDIQKRPKVDQNQRGRPERRKQHYGMNREWMTLKTKMKNS